MDLLVVLIFVVVIIVLIIYYPPRFLITKISKFSDNQVLFYCNLPSSCPKTLALTIDDTPSPYTQKILEKLTKHNSHCTFFIIGNYVLNYKFNEQDLLNQGDSNLSPNIEERDSEEKSHKPQNSEEKVHITQHIENPASSSNPYQILYQITSQGHELGNHTMTNANSLLISDSQLRKDIENTDEILKNYLTNEILLNYRNEESLQTYRKNDENHENYRKKKVKWFRPGSGWYSQRMVKTVKEFKYKLVLGSVYPHDPFMIWKRLNYWYILSKVQSGDIIILHDRSWTVDLLDDLLPALQSRGFKIVTLSKLYELSEEYKKELERY